MTRSEIEDRLFQGVSRRTPGDAFSIRRMGHVLRLSRETRILDVAAGTATSAPLLARDFGARVMAVDRDAAALDRISFLARQLRVDHLVELVQAEEMSLELDGEIFDAVICEGSLPRLGGAQAFLLRFMPHVKVGGGLAFTALCRVGPLDGGEALAALGGGAAGTLDRASDLLLSFPRAGCEPLSVEMMPAEAVEVYREALHHNAAAVLSHAAPPELKAAAEEALRTAEALRGNAALVGAATFVGRKLDHSGISPYFTRHRDGD